MLYVLIVLYFNEELRENNTAYTTVLSVLGIISFLLLISIFVVGYYERKFNIIKAEKWNTNGFVLINPNTNPNTNPNPVPVPVPDPNTNPNPSIV